VQYQLASVDQEGGKSGRHRNRCSKQGTGGSEKFATEERVQKKKKEPNAVTVTSEERSTKDVTKVWSRGLERRGREIKKARKEKKGVRL